MEMKELFSSLKRKEVGRLYLFHGSEELLKREAVDRIRGILVPPSLEQLNLTVIDGDKASADTIINALETLPLMNPRRLVIVKDAAFGSGGKRALGREDMDVLEEYFIRIPEYSCLVINAKSRPDMRTRFIKTLKSVGEVVEFGRLKPNVFEKWVKKQFEANGKSMSAAALGRFLMLTGYLERDSEKTLDDIANETEKLVEYCKGKKTIRKEDIEALISRGPDKNIFRLVDAVGGRDIGTAVKLLADLKQSGEPPIRVLAMLARQFRLLIQAAALREAGYSNKAVASRLGLPPFVIGSMIRQSKNYSEGDLKKALRDLWEAEVRIKSGRTEPWIALELFVAGL
jgi:DNA polymerase-3 subunit delta